jgi:hypothetical protein
MASEKEKGQVLVFVSLWTHVVSVEDSSSFCRPAFERVLKSLNQLVGFEPFDLGVKVENVRNKLSRAGVMDEFNGNRLSDEAKTKLVEMLRLVQRLFGVENVTQLCVDAVAKHSV